PYVGFVAFRSALINASAFFDLRVRVPIEDVPVSNEDSSLTQNLAQRDRNDVEFIVIILSAQGIENLQSALDCQAWCDHKNALRKTRVLRISDFVEDLQLASPSPLSCPRLWPACCKAERMVHRRSVYQYPSAQTRRSRAAKSKSRLLQAYRKTTDGTHLAVVYRSIALAIAE